MGAAIGCCEVPSCDAGEHGVEAGLLRNQRADPAICSANRYTPKEEAAKAHGEDRKARMIAVLKQFAIFNLDQCEGLPKGSKVHRHCPIPSWELPQRKGSLLRPARIGGGEAFDSPGEVYVQVPPQAALPRSNELVSHGAARTRSLGLRQGSISARSSCWNRTACS